MSLYLNDFLPVILPFFQNPFNPGDHFIRPVKNTIVKYAGLIQECFLSMIERSPDIPERGKVLVDCQIDSSGTVFVAGVARDEFLNKEFQKYLGENISRIVFPLPPSRNPVYVEHTFLFRKELKK